MEYPRPRKDILVIEDADLQTIEADLLSYARERHMLQQIKRRPEPPAPEMLVYDVVVGCVWLNHEGQVTKDDRAYLGVIHLTGLPQRKVQVRIDRYWWQGLADQGHWFVDQPDQVLEGRYLEFFDQYTERLVTLYGATGERVMEPGYSEERTEIGQAGVRGAAAEPHGAADSWPTDHSSDDIARRHVTFEQALQISIHVPAVCPPAPSRDDLEPQGVEPTREAAAAPVMLETERPAEATREQCGDVTLKQAHVIFNDEETMRPLMTQGRGYSASTAWQIANALVKAGRDMDWLLWGPAAIAKKLPYKKGRVPLVDAITVGHYLEAFRKRGIRSIESVEVPPKRARRDRVRCHVKSRKVT